VVTGILGRDMKKLFFLLFLYLNINAFPINFSGIKEGDWWNANFIVDLTFAPEIAAEIETYDDTVDTLEFTVAEVTGIYFVLMVEGPNHRRTRFLRKLHIDRDSISISNITIFAQELYKTEEKKITEDNGFSLPEGKSSFIRSPHYWCEVFNIPLGGGIEDSIYKPAQPAKFVQVNDSLTLVFDPLQDLNPFIQKINEGSIRLKNKQINYIYVIMEQGDILIRQIWIEGFPWWIIHKSKAIESEVIESSYYTKEELREIKELIREDIKKGAEQ